GFRRGRRFATRLARQGLLSVLGGIVGHIPAATLQDEGRRGQEPLHRTTTLVARAERRLRNALTHLEPTQAATAFIFVGWHALKQYHGRNDPVKAGRRRRSLHARRAVARRVLQHHQCRKEAGGGAEAPRAVALRAGPEEPRRPSDLAGPGFAERGRST